MATCAVRVMLCRDPGLQFQALVAFEGRSGVTVEGSSGCELSVLVRAAAPFAVNNIVDWMGRVPGVVAVSLLYEAMGIHPRTTQPSPGFSGSTHEAHHTPAPHSGQIDRSASSLARISIKGGVKSPF